MVGLLLFEAVDPLVQEVGFALALLKFLLQLLDFRIGIFPNRLDFQL